MTSTGTGEAGDPFVITVTTDLASLLSDNITAPLTVSGGDVTVAAGGITSAMMGLDLTDWTPTWTASAGSPSIGDGLLEGAYCRLGDIGFVSINLVIGTTTTLGSSGSIWQFDLPSGWDPRGAEAYSVYGGISGIAFRESTGAARGVFMGIRQTESAGQLWQTSTGTRVGPDQPWAWAANDSLSISGWIPLA